MRRLVFIASLFWATQSFSTELVQAWEHALKNSPEILAATEKRNAEFEAKTQSRAALLPSLQGSAHYQEQPQSNANDSTTQGWSIELSQTLFNISKWQQFKKGSVRSVIAELSLIDSRRQLLNKVTEAYFDVLLVKKELTLIEKTKDSIALQLEQAQALYQKGAGTILDFYDAQSAYEEIQTEELATQSKLELSLRKLSTITNFPYRTLKQNTVITDKVQLQTLDYWKKITLEGNSTLKVKSELIAEAEYDVKAAKAQHLPTVDLGLGHQDSMNRRDTGYGGSMRYATRGNYVNVRLTVPIFNGGAITSQTRSAVASREMLRYEYDYARDNVMLQIESLFLDIKTNQSQVKAFTQLSNTNNTKLEATRVGFKAGIRTQVDLIKAERDYLEAQRKLAEAQYRLISNYLILQTVAGELEFTNVARLIN